MEVRAEVSQALEHSRATKEIGSSLAANVELEGDAKTFETLNKLGDELRFVFITSDAKITKSDALKITVTPSIAPKCVRCWHQREDVGSHSEHLELCGRCVENIAGEGEQRLYA
jgi:isoleucyl-tRNA synthetase